MEKRMARIVITVEFLAIFIPLALFGVWYLWYIISKKYLQKKYKPENDKGRIYKRSEGKTSDVRATELGIKRTTQLRTRKLLPTTTSSGVVNDESSTGKTGTSSGKVSNPFRRNKKK